MTQTPWFPKGTWTLYAASYKPSFPCTIENLCSSLTLPRSPHGADRRQESTAQPGLDAQVQLTGNFPLYWMHLSGTKSRPYKSNKWTQEGVKLWWMLHGRVCHLENRYLSPHSEGSRLQQEKLNWAADKSDFYQFTFSIFFLPAQLPFSNFQKNACSRYRVVTMH